MLNKRPWPLVIAGVLLVFLGAALTTDMLKALGPMRRSLESADELSRHFAELEVMVFRSLSIVLGIGALVIAFFWERFCQSNWVRSVWAQPEKPAPAFDMQTIMTMPFFILGSGAIAFLALMEFGPDLFGAEQITELSYEDNLVQQLTAGMFIVASALAFSAAYYDDSRRHKIWMFLLGFGFLICAGEEISWGQRIFGFNTPDAISSINVQNETNIHNMFGYTADHLFISLILFYGAVLPLLVSRYPFINKLCDQFGLPVASPGLAAGFLLVSLMHNWTIQHLVQPPPDFRIEEIREFLSSIGLALLAWQACRKALALRRHPVSTPQSAPGDLTSTNA